MKKLLLPLGCLFALTAGIAHAQVSIRIGPPPPPREVIPVRPYDRPGWVWQPGYHRWDGQRYVWVPGAYVAPPRPGGRWIPGHWRQRRDGWVWIPGQWR